jgi:hypothetical protein
MQEVRWVEVVEVDSHPQVVQVGNPLQELGVLHLKEVLECPQEVEVPQALEEGVPQAHMLVWEEDLEALVDLVGQVGPQEEDQVDLQEALQGEAHQEVDPHPQVDPWVEGEDH